MLKLIISVVGCIYAVTLLGEVEGLTCYHCYDSFTETLGLRSSQHDIYSRKFVRCDKNMNNWNTWDCPEEFPICVIMRGRVKQHVEIIRSCGKRDVCNNYGPPPGVTMDYCRECNSSHCNDFLELPTPPPTPTPYPPPTSTPYPPPTPTPYPPPTPTPYPPPTSTPSPSPPVNPKPLLFFRVNINLKVKKHPSMKNEYLN